ncbi:MAG TPA: sterol desaturase family protein [Polyangiaceae bacterium]|nr:sterol desaturase family protein [Polyangiaceae bacterium]
MHPNLIAAAVPVFFAAIAAEVLVDRWRRTGSYRFGAVMADLETGVISQVGDVFLRGIGVAIYASVYPYRVVEFPAGSPWPWVVGLLGIDFLYYWWHRLSHVVNVLWAVHAVHHQSEDFNLAVALRQPAFEALTIIPFHLPLALLGVDPFIYASCYAIDLIYQFWIHTELPGRLGFLERVLNTPSAHRVHHGINSKYLDRNYGGILVIWDRAFGTYQREEEPAAYGVTHALRSYNPVWANLAPFHDVAAKARAARGVANKIRIWFAHPATSASGEKMPVLPVTRAAQTKYDPRPPRRVVIYVLLHFVLLTAGGATFMYLAERDPMTSLVAPGLLLMLSAVALTGRIEGRRWAFAVDAARQLALVFFAAAYLVPRIGLVPGVATAGGLAMVFLLGLVALWPVDDRSDGAKRTA